MILLQIQLFLLSFDIAISPDGTRAYVPNSSSNNVSVIDIVNNTVINAINVGNTPEGISILSSLFIAPENLQAKTTAVLFPTQTDIVNTTTWDKPENIASYNIYRDANLSDLDG
ncbi:MAG: hypothetical protein PVI40_03975 [Chlamydiota bacterium]